MTMMDTIMSNDGVHHRREKRFAEGERNGPLDHSERRTPRAQASGTETSL
jgi:hypothetical protein